MPDNDVIPRRLGRGWARPFRAAVDGSTAAEVGDQLRTAVAAGLRDSGGCPGLLELAQAARDTALYGDWQAFDQAVRTFQVHNRRDRLSQIMVREVDGRLAADRDGIATMDDHELAVAIAEGGLSRYVDERMWGRGRDLLMERYPSFDQARAFEQATKDHASLPELAARLVTRPDGVGLRAPDRKLKPQPTSVLLDETLD